MRFIGPKPLEGYASRPHDYSDRLLVKTGFIGRCDLVEVLLVFILARQHDLHELARLAHDPVAGRIAPLTPRINDCQSSRKPGRDFAVDEARPGGVAHPHSVAGLAAEH